MELQFLTPTAVWEGFNPKKDPLETSTVFSEDRDFLLSTGTYFTSETFKDGKVRAYVNLCYDKRWKDPRPAVLVVSSHSATKDAVGLTRDIVKAGMVVCHLDFNGSFDGDYKTTFPSSLDYISYPECNNHLDRIDGSARTSPWFQWSKIVRRALSLLEEHPIIDENRIGILGVGKGAQVAWQVAGMDGRVAALVAVNGGGYLWRSGSHRFTMGNVPTNDEERAFSTGVGAETYARFVSCPTCYVVSSNNTYADVDRAEAIISLVPAKSKTLMISRGTVDQITSGVYASLKKWLKRNLTHDSEPVAMPSLAFTQVDNSLYLVLKGEKHFTDKQISVSYGEPDTAHRFWKSLPEGQKVGKHEYVYKVPIYDENELITAFASVSMKDVELSCSPVIGTVPQRLGLKADTPHVGSERIIYNGSMGLGTFSSESNDILLADDNLASVSGPFDIKGISVKSGRLIMYRSTRESFSSQRDALLQFDAYSKDKRTIQVRVHTDKMTFTASVNMRGGEFWQKVSLSASDFKSEYGKPLSLFAEGKKLSFDKAETVVFNNFLWI